MNHEIAQHIARERQQNLLLEAQNSRLANLGKPSIRILMAHWLRDLADKLEPICREAMNPSREEFANSK